MAILAACTHLLYCYFSFECELMKITGAGYVSLACVQTAKALLQADALASLVRLFAADNRRPAGAKLFTMEIFIALQDVVSLLLAVSSVDKRVPKQQLLRQLACSHFLEHWAKELVERAGAQLAAPASSGRGSRGQGGSGAGRSADENTVASFYSFGYVTHHLMTSSILRPENVQPAACSYTARQLLSGRCLQYFIAVRAVSQLYAAAGGPLYGLPYDALLPYLTADRQPGERKGRAALSCAGLRSSIILWDTCLDVCPPKVLRPLRPRHLLALCLRIARVALASLEVANAQEPQPQQEQRQVGGDTDMAVGHSLGGASSAGQLGGVVEALLGPVELRRRLEAKECPELAVAAMELARSLVVARVSGAGGAAAGEESTEGGNGSGCEGGDAASVGCGGSSSGGSGDASGGGEGVDGYGYGDGGGGGSIVGPAQLTEKQPRAWAKPLLRDPSFADGWWRLALGIVRAALQQDRGREQPQQQQREVEEAELLVDDEVVRCTSLLLPLHLGALGHCAAEELPDPSIVPGLRTALDAGYIPCLEAVLRRRLVPYMLDHECKRYSCTSSTGPHALTFVLGKGPLLQLLLAHGAMRQAAAVSTSTAKMLLSVARTASRKAKEDAGAGSSKSSGSGGGGSSGGSGGSSGGSGGSSEGSGSSGSSSVPASSCRELHGAIGIVASAFIDLADAAHNTLCALVFPLVYGCRRMQGQRVPLFPTAEAVLPAAEPRSSRSSDCAGLSSGPCGLLRTADPEVGPQFTPLVGFALPRWLRLSVHLVDLCDTLHVAPPVGAEGTVRDIRLTVTGAAAMVLDACDAAHQAGDGRALGSWRQLLYDIASYGWVRDALDELRPLGRQAAGCWHRRGWEPAGPTHGTQGHPHGTPGSNHGTQGTYGTAQGPALETPPGPTHGTPGAPAAMGDADSGAGAGGGGGRIEGEGRDQGSGGGEELAAVEALGGLEGVPAGVLPPPCEAWRVLPTCCYPLCTNLEEDSEADLPLRVWGPGAGAGAGAGAARAGLEGGAERGGGEGGGSGGGGGVKGSTDGSTGTGQCCDQGGGGQLYCSRQCYVAHAVYMRTRQAAEKGHQAREGA